MVSRWIVLLDIQKNFKGVWEISWVFGLVIELISLVVVVMAGGG